VFSAILHLLFFQTFNASRKIFFQAPITRGERELNTVEDGINLIFQKDGRISLQKLIFITFLKKNFHKKKNKKNYAQILSLDKLALN